MKLTMELLAKMNSDFLEIDDEMSDIYERSQVDKAFSKLMLRNKMTEANDTRIFIEEIDDDYENGLSYTKSLYDFSAYLKKTEQSSAKRAKTTISPTPSDEITAESQLTKELFTSQILKALSDDYIGRLPRPASTTTDSLGEEIAHDVESLKINKSCKFK